MNNIQKFCLLILTGSLSLSTVAQFEEHEMGPNTLAPQSAATADLEAYLHNRRTNPNLQGRIRTPGHDAPAGELLKLQPLNTAMESYVCGQQYRQNYAKARRGALQLSQLGAPQRECVIAYANELKAIIDNGLFPAGFEFDYINNMTFNDDPQRNRAIQAGFRRLYSHKTLSDIAQPCINFEHINQNTGGFLSIPRRESCGTSAPTPTTPPATTTSQGEYTLQLTFPHPMPSMAPRWQTVPQSLGHSNVRKFINTFRCKHKSATQGYRVPCKYAVQRRFGQLNNAFDELQRRVDQELPVQAN